MKGLAAAAALSATIVLAAVCGSTRAADKPTPPEELLRRRVAYSTRAMLTDGYEKGGWKNRAWDDDARAAIKLHIRRTTDDPAEQPDDQDALHEALSRCMSVQVEDVFVQYIAARNLPHRNAPREHVIRAHLGLAWQHEDLAKYTPLVRAQVYLRGAQHAGMSAADRLGHKHEKDAGDYVKRGMAALAEAVAEADVTPHAIHSLCNMAGEASLAVEGDRMVLVDAAAKALRQAKVSEAIVLSELGGAKVLWAWDARGDRPGRQVTDAQHALFRERLAEARKLLERAYELDPHNAVAATKMITVATGEGAAYDEMDKWYRRAIEADPYRPDPFNAKAAYLEPKWHGSRERLIAFGRELFEAGKWETGQPMQLLDAHVTLAGYGPRKAGASYRDLFTAYFEDNESAYKDVKEVCEAYLKRHPNGRYVRTRYAFIAACAGQWTDANRQFKLLGLDWNRRVLSSDDYAELTALAAANAAPAK